MKSHSYCCRYVFLGFASVIALLVSGCGGVENEQIDSRPILNNSSVCWNDALNKVGGAYSATYVGVGSREGSTRTVDYRVAEREQLVDYSSSVTPMSSVSDVTDVIGNSEPNLWQTSLWFEPNAANHELGIYRDAVRYRQIVAGQLQSYVPSYVDKRYSLFEGESLHVDRKFSRTDWYNIDQTITQGLSDQLLITFEKIESVATRAGDFSACKFVESSTVGAKKTSWVIVGKGVPARIVTCGPSFISTSSECEEYVLSKLSLSGN